MSTYRENKNLAMSALPLPSKKERTGVFSRRNGRLFFAGQLISMVGSSMQLVALGWVALDLSHNGLMLGLVNSVPILAMLVAGPFGGYVADRFSARRVLVVTNAVQGLVAAGLGVLASQHVLALWQLVVGALLVGVMASISVPTTQVFVGEIAADSHLPQAINVNNAIMVLSSVIGYILVGPTINWLGTAGVISINAVSYLASISALLLIRGAELHPRQKSEKAGAQLSEAVAFLRTQLNLKVFLAITAVVSLFTANLPTLLLLMSEDDGARTYGTLLTALTIGSTVGAAALVRVKPALGTVIVGSLLLGLLEAAIPIASNFAALIAVLFVMGAITLVLQTGLLTMVQLQTRPDLRGRVLAIFMSVFRACDLTGTLMAGWLAHVGGPRALIGVEGWATAVALVAICVVLVATRALSISRSGKGFAFALRREELNLWYPETMPDEASEVTAVHRAHYARALDATLLNMTTIGGVLLDPTAIEQLIPPRRGEVQGPAARPAEPAVEATVEVEPADAAADAAKTSVSQDPQDRRPTRFYSRT